MAITNRERRLLSLLTAEEIRALDYFAARTGPRWKVKLSDAWMNGGVDLAVGAAELMSVRNKIGPSGLLDLRGKFIRAAANGEAL